MKSINLKKGEVDYLNCFVKKGNKSARALTKARILLLMNKQKKGKEIQDMLDVGRSTIWRVRRDYLGNGVDYALTERERSGQPKKYDNKKRVEIIAYACTNPPNGRKRWSIRLLTEELKKKKGFKTINRETIRLVLKKTTQSHG